MLDKGNLAYTFFYVLLFLILASVAIFIFIYKARNKFFAAALKVKELEIKHQKDILLATLITQEQERERIAKDLHDEISSMLNVQSLHIHSLKNGKLLQEQRLLKIEELLILNNQVVESARQIAHNLMPPVIQKFGLNTALEELIADFEKNNTLVFNYNNGVDLDILDREKQLHIFRIIQELINNSIKHGQANTINLSFEKNDQKIFCAFTDNGKGFATDKLETSKGLGMHNIESRITFLNGQYQIHSGPNKGFQFKFNFKNV
jgi:signal transduction histidine kinase